MAGPLDLSSMMHNMSKLSGSPSYDAHLMRPDTRSRTEVREDFERKLASLGKDSLVELKQKILDTHDEKDFWSLKEDVEDFLVKFTRYIDEFEKLNADESRKVAVREQELRLESRHDWSAKFRLFFFRVLASGLLIFTLFAIGYIEHEFDWARLPMSKYLNTSANVR